MSTSDSACNAHGGAFPRSVWEGHYYDGQSAERQAVTVTIAVGGLSIRKTDGSIHWWSSSEVRRSLGSGASAPVRLEHGHPLPATLVIADPAFLTAAAQIDPPGRLGKPAASRWWTLAAMAVGTVVAGAVFYLWLLPAAGEAAAEVMPVSWEEKLGPMVVSTLAPPGIRCADPQLESAMSEVIRALTADEPPSPYTIRVYLVDQPVVNALAAPGGYIVVYSGLVRMTNSPHELAGVLAHELQHVFQRHSSKGLMRSLAFWGLLSLVLGDTSGLLVQVAGTVSQLRYQRADEESADREAMRMMGRARLDRKAMVTLFRKLERQAGEMPQVLRYLSSHPLPADRTAYLEAMAAQPAPPIRPLLANLRWPPDFSLCRVSGGSGEARAGGNRNESSAAKRAPAGRRPEQNRRSVWFREWAPAGDLQPAEPATNAFPMFFLGHSLR